MTSREIALKLHSLLPDYFGARRNGLLHYAIVVLSMVIALGTNLLFYPLLRGTPAALFYVAVMVSSWAGGLRPGLVTTGLSTLALHYFFVEPRYSLGLNSLSAVVQLSVFAMAAVLISTLNESRLKAKRRADANLKAWRESEAQLTRLAEANIIGIFAARSNGLITEANDAFLKTVGYTREDLLAGRIRWMEMSPPEYQEISERSQQKLRATGICPPFEQEYLRKDGSRVPILLGLVMQDEQTINGFVLDRSEFQRNESERQQAETAMRESEERLRLAMEGAQMGTWDVDLITGKALWSDQHFLMLGYEPTLTGEASEALWFDRIHPDDQERVGLEWQQSRQERRSYRARYRIIRADTQQIAWLSALGSFIYNSDGEAIRSLGVLFDITERKRDEEALREAEERLRVALKNAPITVFNQDCDLKYTWLHNPVLYDLNAMLGKHDRDYLPAEDAELLTAIKQQVLNSGIGSRQEVRVSKDGTGYYYDLTVEPLRDAKDVIVGITCAAIDISGLKQTEMALREREQRLELATHAAGLGVFEWNVQADLAVWENLRMYEIFGRTPEEGAVSNAESTRIIHPDDLATFEQDLADSFEHGNLHTVCRIQRWNDGEWRWVELSGQVEFASDGTPLRLVGVVGDITDRKQAEAELKQSQSLLQSIIDNAGILVYVKNLAGRFILVNQQFERVFGRTKDEFVGKTDYDFFPTELAEAFREKDRSVMAGESIESEEIALHTDGLHDYISVKFPLYNAAGQIYAICGVSTDITERKRIAAERERLLKQEQAAREAAEQANRIKDEFLAVLSHELRSPLNPILGWTKLLQSRPFTPEKTAQALATIERNAKLQSQLIEDLLDVSRILQGKMVLNVCPVNLVTTIEAAIETVRLAAEAKGIEIHTSLDTAIGTVAGDVARLQQMVWNLLTNAVKFTPEGGRVEVRLTAVRKDEKAPSRPPTLSLAHYAQITVTDTGKGIDSEFLPHVFDYFRQEDGATTRKFGGLGLGLALVRHLAEQHGGAVEAESAGEGQGATFTIRLPLQPLLPEPDPERPSASANFDLSNLKILAIDDEADMRELMLAILEEQGAQVRVVASAVEAISLLEQWQPDLLISDIGMPEVDGYMFLRQVRSRSPDQGGSVPAIALTAYAGEIDQQQAIAAGFQRHLAKPVEPEQLMEVIHGVIQANAPPPV